MNIKAKKITQIKVEILKIGNTEKLMNDKYEVNIQNEDNQVILRAEQEIRLQNIATLDATTSFKKGILLISLTDITDSQLLRGKLKLSIRNQTLAYTREFTLK